MELAMWSVWALLLVWYLNALRGDIRGVPVAEELTPRTDAVTLTTDGVTLTEPSRQT